MASEDQSSMATEESSLSATALRTVILIAFNNAISMKLDVNNFLVWRKQVLAAVKGYKLSGFLTGISSAPIQFLSASDKEIGAVNPRFSDWEQQDQLLVSWLLSSMSEGVLSRMINCDTSAQIWSTLEVYFAAQVRAKISQYQTQLQQLKKNSLSMNEYLLKVRHTVDLLSLVGEDVSVRAHVDAICNGLPAEYDTFVLATTARSEDFTVETFESLLLAQESRIETRMRELESSVSKSVNLASHSTDRKKPEANENLNPNANFASSSPVHRGGRGGRGRGRSNRGYWSGGGSKPVCQVCGRIGHVALDCFYRYDDSYRSQTQQQFRGGFNRGRGFGRGSQPQAMFAAPAQAYFAASPHYTPDHNWYPDSGASSHVTADLNNLAFQSDYHGQDQVHIGNGKGLPILHIGHSLVSSPSTSQKLSLSNLLSVPEITKNLLSVS